MRNDRTRDSGDLDLHVDADGATLSSLDAPDTNTLPQHPRMVDEDRIERHRSAENPTIEPRGFFQD